jgi:hypothetical protein
MPTYRLETTEEVVVVPRNDLRAAHFPLINSWSGGSGVGSNAKSRTEKSMIRFKDRRDATIAKVGVYLNVLMHGHSQMHSRAHSAYPCIILAHCVG